MGTIIESLARQLKAAGGPAREPGYW